MTCSYCLGTSLCRPFWSPPPHEKTRRKKRRYICVTVLVCICVGVIGVCVRGGCVTEEVYCGVCVRGAAAS